MPRETPPVFYEYVDKSTVWPRWVPPHHAPHAHAQQPATQLPIVPQQQQQPNFIVVNNTNRPIPMQALLHLLSRYAIPRQLTPQPIPQPSPQQAPPNQLAPPQPVMQQTIVIVVNQGDELGDTDSIMNRLFMAQQPQTVPASQSFINSLTQTPITQEAIAKQAQCTICMEEFHVDENATQLPCLHYFHHDCIKPWLQTQHTCPMCRHELPTDAPARIFLPCFLFFFRFLFCFLLFSFSSLVSRLSLSSCFPSLFSRSLIVIFL